MPLNKHQKHFSTAANFGDSDSEDDQQSRRDSISSDAGLWSVFSVYGGSDIDETQDALPELKLDSESEPSVYTPTLAPTTPTDDSKFEFSLKSDEAEGISEPSYESKTPLGDSLLDWFDQQAQELGFEGFEQTEATSETTSIKILPTQQDWSSMLKLSTPAKIVYLLRRFLPESSRASWFASKEKLFFARLAPEEMIRYLYLSRPDREVIMGAYHWTLGSREKLVSEERRKVLVRFVFEGETVNLA